MEITLGVLPPRRATRSRLRGGWRPLRQRRPRARERAVISVDDLLRYRLLERLSGARHWPWAGADPGRALPAPLPRAPTPDYELLELESEAAVAEATAVRDAAGRDAGVVAGAFMIALTVLVVLAHVVQRCLNRGTKEEPIEEQIVPSQTNLPNTDPPPPYTELPSSSEDKPGEEPPPPYSACYVAFSNHKDEPVQYYNERDTLLDGENIVVNLESSEDHRTRDHSTERLSSRQDSAEYSRRGCEYLQVVT